MGAPWMVPARVLVAQLDRGIEGLWSLVYAAQVGVLQLALGRGPGGGVEGDLTLTLAAMDLGEAIEELEWHHPDLPAVASAVDLGPAPPDGLADCRLAVAELLVAALDVVAGLLRDPEQPIDTTEVLYLARIVHLLTNAHLRVTGRMP
jgi:hypothetical protein